MTNKEFAKMLEERTLIFGIEIIKLSSSLPNNTEIKVIRNQITKSGTSIGANYREANRSRSTKDFKNKIKISEAEASETIYWLKILNNLNIINKNDKIMKEANEILAIFTSIANKLE
jgi:four helix bundle protein